VTEPGLQADSPLVTVPLQTRDEPELVRQHYLGEPTKLINAQLDLLAVVIDEPDAFPIVLGVTADHDPGVTWCSTLPVMWCSPTPSSQLPGGHVPNLIRAAMVQRQSAATTLPRIELARPS
jgi:hypothetical protein